MTRNVKFTFSAGTATGNQTATSSFNMTVFNSAGAVVYGPSSILVTAPNTVTVAITWGTGYKATLSAIDATGTSNANPPSVIFDVTAPPMPADPILNVPILL